MKRGTWFLLVLAMLVGIATQTFAQTATLTVADCAKCHDLQTAQIEAKGAKHKTAIDCQACHEGHRPKVAKNIPECSNCHSGAQHYTVKNCVGCHNPHQPLEITLTGQLKDICLTCHVNPGKELVASPSKHAALACNFCHADKHGVIPNCVDCHSPHAPTMTQAECKVCHQAHKPLELKYASSTPSSLCASCHGDVLTMITANPTKHNKIACVTCHADQHKTVPKCSDCHGLPHKGIHDKFPNCGQCHNIAHDLNNFSKAPAPKAPAPAPAPAKKK